MSVLVNQVSQKLLETQNILVTAESCTGGMIAAALTDIAGSSAFFDRGFVTYSNQSKIDSLGVSSNTLDIYGAVSEQTAKEMAQGALIYSQATIAISVTGIAGPTGGTKEKPLGLVYIGLCKKGQNAIVTKNNFDGDRCSVRTQTMNAVFNLILNHL